MKYYLFQILTRNGLKFAELYQLSLHDLINIIFAPLVVMRLYMQYIIVSETFLLIQQYTIHTEQPSYLFVSSKYLQHLFEGPIDDKSVVFPWLM